MSIVDSERALEHLATILETDDVRLLQEFIRSIDEQDLAIVARKAAAFGATRSLSALLECGVDVNSEWHGSLIRVAAQRGKLDAVHLLIDRGADIDSDNPLLDATVGGHMDIVKLLVSRGADINAGYRGFPTPLAAAIEFNHPEIEAYLRAHGATELVGRGLGPDKQVDAEPGSLREQLEHLFGAAAYWSGNRTPDAPGLHVFLPTDGSPWWTVVTDGMSAHSMRGAVADSGATRAELVLRLPPSWPVGHALKQSSTEAAWPIDSLLMVAEYPRRYGAVLRLGETVAFDEPPAPLHPSTKLA
ncbi:MAG: suppressor of fused domain protein, partial [Myxococcales bacterium]|nr:suppressor of fused domain protein [Myxococcales bacterium]